MRYSDREIKEIADAYREGLAITKIRRRWRCDYVAINIAIDRYKLERRKSLVLKKKEPVS